MNCSIVNEERFPFLKLDHKLAFKVAEKIPFGTFESQRDDIPSSKWYPLLSFELCSCYTAGICRSLTTRKYYAVNINVSSEDCWSIVVKKPGLKREFLNFEQVKYMNFALHVYKLSLFDNSYNHYNLLFAGLQSCNISIRELELTNVQWSLEEICQVVEDFEVQRLGLLKVKNISYDLLFIHPIIQQLKGLAIYDCEDRIMEETFLKQSLDSFFLSSITRNLTSSSVNKFIKQWTDGSRNIDFVSLYFKDDSIFQERSIILDGHIFKPTSKDCFLLKRADGDAIEISLIPNYLLIKRCLNK